MTLPIKRRQLKLKNHQSTDTWCAGFPLAIYRDSQQQRPMFPLVCVYMWIFRKQWIIVLGRGYTVEYLVEKQLDLTVIQALTRHQHSPQICCHQLTHNISVKCRLGCNQQTSAVLSLPRILSLFVFCVYLTQSLCNLVRSKHVDFWLTRTKKLNRSCITKDTLRWSRQLPATEQLLATRLSACQSS